MPSFNQVILLGNLTRDLEVRQTNSGKTVANFGLAVNRSWKDDTGATREEVYFADLKAFGKQAETLARYVRKGDPLMVTGRLTREEWEKDGVKKSATRIVVDQFQFLGKKPDGPGRPADNNQPAATAQAGDEPPY